MMKPNMRMTSLIRRIAQTIPKAIYSLLLSLLMVSLILNPITWADTRKAVKRHNLTPSPQLTGANIRALGVEMAKWQALADGLAETKAIENAIIKNTRSSSGRIGKSKARHSIEMLEADSDSVTKAVQSGNAAQKARKAKLSELIAPSLGLFVEMFSIKSNGATIVTDPVGAAQVFKTANRLARGPSSGYATLPPKDALKYGLDIAGNIYSIIKHKNIIAAGIYGGKLALSLYELDKRNSEFLNKGPMTQVAQPLNNANIESRTDNHFREKIAKAQELAKTDPKFKEAFDSVYGELFNASITDNGYTIVQKNLDLPEYWRTIIRADGTISASIDGLEKRFQDECTGANDITNDTLARLKKYPPTFFPQNLSLALADYDALAEARRYQENEKKINDIAGTVSFISGVVAKVNPKLGREMGIVGNGVADIARTINNFKQTTEKIFDNFLLKKFNFSDNFKNFVGGAVMTANVVGIALQVFSMFGNSGPSPEQMILEQIQELRKEVQQVRKEMHERFDHIDRSLNEIYDTMDKRFNQIDLVLGRIDGNVDSIREELIKLQDDLNRVENSVYTWLEVGFKREFVEAVDNYLGYKERVGLDIPYRPEYVTAESYFHVWATKHSSDEIQAPLDNRSYSDENIYTELRQRPAPDLGRGRYTDPNNYQFATNINYIAQFPYWNLELPALATERLANPADWILSTEAYLQLAREWPENAAQIQNKEVRLANVQHIGKKLQEAVESITTLKYGNSVKANRQLWDAVIAKYRGKASALRSEINGFELSTLKQFNQVGVNIWGGGNQTTTQIPRIQTINACNGRVSSLSMPPNVLGRIPNVARLADLLNSQGVPGLSNINVCLDIKWVNKYTSNGRLLGNVAFTLMFTYQNKIIYAPYVYVTNNYDVSNDPSVINSWLDRAAKNWTQKVDLSVPISGDFADGEDGEYFADDADRQQRQQTLSEIAVQVDQSLKELQARYYSQVTEELRKTGNIQSAARNLSGAKALLDAYIALGMSQSLETNDFLRSLLYGSERVADEQIVKGIYEDAIAALSKPEGKTVPKVDIATTINPRIEALAKVLQEILGQIEQYHRDKQRDPLYYNYPESLSSVDSTLQELQIHNPEVTVGNVVAAHPQSLTTPTNKAIAVTLFGTDTKGTPITYSIAKQPAHGTLTGNLPELLYTPEKDYSGKDSFTFRVYNGSQYSNEATVAISISKTTNLCSNVSFKVPYFYTLSQSVNYGVRSTPTANAAPYASAVGDFNGDGKPDLAVANWGSDEVAILLGDGSGGFGTATYIPNIRRPYGIAIGDFNGDGKFDLAATQNDGTTNQIAILLGDGTGKFGTPAKISVGAVPYGIATGDFNKDGKVDLVVVNHDSHNLSLLVGDGQGRFAAAKNFAVGTSPIAIVAADFNKDGNLDVAVTNSDTHNISILLGNGQGNFSATTNYGVGRFPEGIVTGDFNGDTKLDLAASNTDTKDVSILLGDGTGRFGAAINYGVGIRARSLAAFDFNRDGKLDLISADDTTGRVGILRGSGNGSFTLDGTYSGGTGITSVIVNDLNKDSVPDLVFTNLKSHDVSVRLSNGMSDFNTPPDISVGTRPYAVIVEDFNGDGKPDIATANTGANNISFALGSGNGEFSKATNYATGTRPLFVISGDFNNDKKPDLAVTNLGAEGTPGSGGVSILIGDGTGKFTKSTDIRTFKVPFAIATGDFNRDGKADLAVTDAYGTNVVPNNVSILIGNGAGGFTQGATLTAGGTPVYINTIDLNRDGKLDLIVTNSNTNDVSMFLGDGSGKFTSVGSFGTADGPVHQVVDDFDKDGYSDLAQLNTRSNYKVAMMLGAEGNRFEGFTNYNFATKPGSAVPGDFDLDGNLDLAVGQEGANSISILSGDGYGIFGNTNSFGNGIEPASIAKGDFNQDGKLDLVVANQNNNSVTILLNTTCLSLTPVANVATVSAASYIGNGASAESIVSAFGQGLAASTQLATSSPLPTALAGTTVKIKDSVNSERLAPLFFVSPGQVNYLIPQGTVTGLATITVTSGNGNVSTGPLLITSIAPGVFSADASGKGYAAANFVRVTKDNRLIEQSITRYDTAQNKFVANPIEFTADTQKIVLVLFGTAWRQRSSSSAVSVKIGGITAPVEYAGLQPDYVGLDQINVEIPRTLIGRGDVDIAVSVDGVAANTVKVNIK